MKIRVKVSGGRTDILEYEAGVELLGIEYDRLDIVVPATIPAPAPAQARRRVVATQGQVLGRELSSGTDVVIPLGVTVPLIFLPLGLRDVSISGPGTCAGIVWPIPATDAQRASSIRIADLSFQSPTGNCLSIYGDDVRIERCQMNALQYCIFAGAHVPVRGITLVDCTCTSQGQEATLRFTHVTSLSIQGCVLSNGMKHALRVHGTSRLIDVVRTELQGAGNGIGMFSYASTMPTNISDVLLDDVSIRCTGPDLLNIPIDDTVKALEMDKVTLYLSVTSWNPLPYLLSHAPADWHLTDVSARV